ncbi:MAG: SurA N-terminal domain-containing protein [Phycisphaeraceae bacterium]|nr:SurA N-terminal domain-containing protein [Phycisphaeraceae bacterium]
MLKWLRKYNTWILVIAGSLLMVTFLLAEALQGLGKGSPRTTVLVVDGRKISARELDRARVEHAALNEVIGLQGAMRVLFGIEDSTHWLLLTHEAEKAGLVGGPEDGQRFIAELARQIVRARAFMLRDTQQMQTMIAETAANIEMGVEQVARGPARMSRDEVLTGLSRLQGVARLRASYLRVPRLSDRRLVADFRRMEDSAAIDYVFMPAERELRNVERPSEAVFEAHFEKFKDVVAEEDESGFPFGYRLGDRLRLEWLVVSRRAAESAVTADPIEVQKRLRRKFPDGRPDDGTSVEQAIETIEAEVKREQADRVMRLAEQAVRAEFDRVLRGLPQTGPYYVLPENWSEIRPSMASLRDVIVRRVEEATGSRMEAPVAHVRGEWATQSELAELEGIGLSFVMRGPRGVPFTEVAMGVRELAGDSAVALQAGVPGEVMTTRTGDRVFFVITEARKSSAPDSMEEVRTKVVSDVMRLEAFNRLRGLMEENRSRVIADGLGALSISPEVVASMGGVVMAAELPVNKATVRRDFMGGTAPNLNDVDHEAFRTAVLEAASKLDPTRPIEEAAMEGRVVAAAIPQTLGVGFAVISGLNPVTAERLRVQQGRAVDQVMRGIVTLTPEDDPFSMKSLRARLKVEDRRPRDQRDDEDGAI